MARVVEKERHDKTSGFSYVKWALVFALLAHVAYFLHADQQLDESILSSEPFHWPTDLRYRKVRVASDLEMNFVEGGKKDSGTMLLFVHGFPETAYAWKDHMSHFASQGYYVIAPDTRYNNGSMPSTGGQDLTLTQLKEDLVGLINAVGKEKSIFVVCHDWGSVPSWLLAIENSELIKGLITFNIPHPHLYMSYNTFRLPFSLSKIWYFIFWGGTGPLGLWKTTRNEFGWLKNFAFSSALPGAFSKADIAHYEKNMKSRGDNLLNWYSMGLKWLLQSSLPCVSEDTTEFGALFNSPKPSLVPVLQLFGSMDIAVSQEMAIPAVDTKYVPDPKSHAVVMHASHWLPHERVADTAREMQIWMERVLNKNPVAAP